MKMAKKACVAALTAIFLLAAVSFVGCEEQSGEGKALSGSMQIVIAPDADTEATVVEVNLEEFTDRSTAFDVIDRLADSGKICYKGTKGIYGLYFTAIGVPQGEGENVQDSFILEEDRAAGRFLYIYTSVEKDMNDGEYALTVSYRDRVLTDSVNGISKMSIESGCVVYFTYLYWN